MAYPIRSPRKLIEVALPLDAINIRAGGLGIPGAVIGGVAALYFYCRRKKMSIAPLLDIAAPGLALGQAAIAAARSLALQNN